MIASVQYQDDSNTGVIITFTNSRPPQVVKVRRGPIGEDDPLPNALWREVEAWEALPGNIIDPADPPPAFEPSELAVMMEALTFGPAPVVNQGQLTAARQRLRDAGP